MANKGKDHNLKLTIAIITLHIHCIYSPILKAEIVRLDFEKASSNYILSIGTLWEASSPTMGVVRRQGLGKGWTKKDVSSVPPALCLVGKLESPPSMNCCRVRHLRSPTLTVTPPGKGSQWGKWRREGIWVKDWFCLHVRAGLASRKVPTGSD